MTHTIEELERGTSKPVATPAMLVLEDGSVFRGRSCGVPGEAWGEICFNTSMEGYLEVITDPSYAGQIVVMTYPQIGNYGVCLEDIQAKEPALRALVVRDMCYTPSNWRSEMTLPEFLEREGVVAIEGIDTRALVRHIRERGAMRALISTMCEDASALVAKASDVPSLVGENLVATVGDKTCGVGEVGAADAVDAGAAEAPEGARYRVVVYDCGVKRAILQCLEAAGCDLSVVPWDTTAADVLALDPDGVFLSNGPGDPEAVEATYSQVQELLGKVPLFGICLGHQMMSLAAGASIVKLPYGHHGGNQPVMNLRTGHVEITVQNHGFNLDFSSLGRLIPDESGGRIEHPEGLMDWVCAGIAPVVDNPSFGRIQLTHVNLNDATAEGIAFLDIPAFCVQYHPEACPGPTDSRYLFEDFAKLMDESKGGGRHA